MSDPMIYAPCEHGDDNLGTCANCGLMFNDYGQKACRTRPLGTLADIERRRDICDILSEQAAVMTVEAAMTLVAKATAYDGAKRIIAHKTGREIIVYPDTAGTYRLVREIRDSK